MTVLPSPTPAHDDSVHTVVHRYTLWALNNKVGRWVTVLDGLSHQDGIDEIRTRQERLRRDGHHQCRFKLLPIGRTPDG